MVLIDALVDSFCHNQKKCATEQVKYLSVAITFSSAIIVVNSLRVCSTLN